NFMIRTACTILHPTVKSIYNQLDYREYGGACLLGVKGNIVIAHGRSDFGAIKNAIYAAKIMIENNFVQAMSNFVSTNEAEEMSKEKLAVKAEEDI
ncbi:MAG: hypothetical protein NTV30_01610, partial [Chloroflexi bacterium]|nr:hypothetical protein [Chloroflexota bacterium]